MLANLFPITNIHFPVFCKKWSRGMKHSYSCSLRQFFSGFANKQGQLAISLTSELCQQIALARIIHNRTSQILRPLSKVCYKVKSVDLVLGTQWGVFL